MPSIPTVTSPVKPLSREAGCGHLDDVEWMQAVRRMRHQRDSIDRENIGRLDDVIR